MPPRDIDQRVNVTGNAEQQLDAIADAAKKVNDANEDGAVKAERAAEATDQATQANEATTRSQRDSAEAMRDAGTTAEQTANKKGLLIRAIGGMRSAALSLAGGLAGVGGLVAIYRAWNAQQDAAIDKLKEQIALTRELAEARLNFVALQDVEDPTQLRQIESAAAVAGRDPAEVFRVAGIIQSQFPNETEANRQALLRETAAAAQLTDASLPEIAQGLSVLFRETGDAQQAGNILQEAIQQAGEADPGRLASEIGKFIGVGKQIGGLDTGEAAGVAAALTGLGLPNEVATTGGRNVLFALRGKGTPEGIEVLDRLDIDRTNVFTALQQISEARVAGQISDAELEALGGKEAAPVFASLADPTKLRNFLASVQLVDQAEDFDGSIAADKAIGIFEPDSIQALNLIAKQAESRAKALDSSSRRAAQAGAAIAVVDEQLAFQLDQGNITPSDVERIREEFLAQLAQGKTPAEAADIAERERASDVPLFRNPFSGRTVDLNIFAGAGGDRDKIRGESDFLEGPIEQRFELGPDIPNQPTTVIQNQTVNNGTIIRGSADPVDGDFTGEDR
ncbi:MAG: hypothetical protein AAF085_10815 [Planctomycetota bacterium]